MLWTGFLDTTGVSRYHTKVEMHGFSRCAGRGHGLLRVEDWETGSRGAGSTRTPPTSLPTAKEKTRLQELFKVCPQWLAQGDQCLVRQYLVVLLGSAVVPPLVISSKMQVPLVHVSTMRCPTLIPGPFTP